MNFVIDINTENDEQGQLYAEAVEDLANMMVTLSGFDNGLTPMQNYFILELHRTHCTQHLASLDALDPEYRQAVVDVFVGYMANLALYTIQLSKYIEDTNADV